MSVSVKIAGLLSEAKSGKEAIAAWALNSYPEKGDANFIVRASGPNGGLAGEFFNSLRSHFVAQPFIRAIQSAIAEIKGEVAVSIESQEEARKLWKNSAEEFLTAMYKAHGNGKKAFGDYDAIEKWVKSKMGKSVSEAKLNGAKQFKAKAEEIGTALAHERYNSSEYKRILAKARKELAPLVDGEEEVDYVILKAEKFADAYRDDMAAGQSLARTAPLGDSFNFFKVNALLECVVAILNEDAASGSHDYKVGDILYSMWGYDQTNITYYQVVGMTKKGISIREISKKYMGSSGTEDKVMPVPDSFEDEVLKKVVNQFGRVKINSYSTAGKWDGKPKEQTASGYGH